MNRFFRSSLVVPVALTMLLVGVAYVAAAPFKVGQTTCGALGKTKDTNGNVTWAVMGCPELEKALLEQRLTCGDGVVDPNEQCDTGGITKVDREHCGGTTPFCAGDVCRCVATVDATPTPTPGPGTPTPAFTPPPTPPAACPFGELPFDSGLGGKGVQKRRFSTEGESQTYCYTVTSSSPTAIQFKFAADTGTCMWDNLTVVPPPNAGVSTQTSAFGLTGGITYRFVPNPAGTWLVTITDSTDTVCVGTYRLYAQ
jgi:hypothetical protein